MIKGEMVVPTNRNERQHNEVASEAFHKLCNCQPFLIIGHGKDIYSFILILEIVDERRPHLDVGRQPTEVISDILVPSLGPDELERLF